MSQPKPTPYPRGHRVAVTALIRDTDGRVLVIFPTGEAHRWWQLPGGLLEVGESPVEGLASMLHEQLTLPIEVGALHVLAYTHALTSRERPALILLFDGGRYHAEALDEIIWPHEGVAAWNWVTWAEAMKVLHPYEARRLINARQQPNTGTYLEQPQHHRRHGTGESDATGRAQPSAGRRAPNDGAARAGRQRALADEPRWPTAEDAVAAAAHPGQRSPGTVVGPARKSA